MHSNYYQEAEKNKPKLPQNAFFKFRNERTKNYVDCPNKKDRIKVEWDHIEPDVKKRLEKEFQKELEVYKV